MSLFFTYGGIGDLGTTTVRLGKLAGLASSAENGTIATSGWPLDDPAATLVPVGLKACTVRETTCSTTHLWDGFATDRTLARGQGDSLRTGAQRRWDGGLVDLNAALSFLVLRKSIANRPAETDQARIAWFLASEFNTNTNHLYAIADNGRVASTNAVSLSPADYRGQFAAQLLADCMQASGNNGFLYWDETKAVPLSLFYEPASYTGWDSTLRLSNVLSDVDSSTTFAATATLNRDPSEVYTDVLLNWAGGQSHYRNTATTVNFYDRSTVVDKPNITTAAHAQAFADAFLTDHSTEIDRITATVKLPASKVNLILAGQRISVKFSHLHGYTAFSWLHVLNRNVAQDEEDETQYNVTLGLMEPRGTTGVGSGTGGTIPPGPGTTPFQGGSGAPGLVNSYCARSTSATGWFLPWTPAAGSLLLIVAHQRNGGQARASSAWIPVPPDATAWTIVRAGSGRGFGPPSIVAWAKIADGTEHELHPSIDTGGTAINACFYNYSSGAVTDITNPTTNDVDLTQATPYGPPAVTVVGAAAVLVSWVVREDSGPIAGYSGLSAGLTSDYDDGVSDQYPKSLFAHAAPTTNLTPTVQFSRGDTFALQAEATTLVIAKASEPIPTQLVTGESANGDGSTVTFTPTYPYVVNSLKVWVDGVPIIAGLTATNGTTFTLDFAPKAARGDSPAEKVTWSYQRA